MELERYIDDVHRQLTVAAEAGGDDARALAERLIAPLDVALRLTLQEALAAAAEAITTELAPGSVELRLRGRDPEFVVTPPPPEPSGENMAEGDDEVFSAGGAAPPPSVEGNEGAMTRINLRLPDQLKARIERAADGEGLSTNAWLVRAAAAALDRNDPDRPRRRRVPQGAERYTGWAR